MKSTTYALIAVAAIAVFALLRSTGHIWPATGLICCC